jgi:hypothetical protein
MVENAIRKNDADRCRRRWELRVALGNVSEGKGFPEIDFDAERHVYRKDGIIVPHVTQILAASGKCDWSCVDEEIRLHSIKRGQSVHWLTQLEDEGALNYRTVPIGLRGYRKAYRTWKRYSGFHVIWIERQFISQYGFAGTLDRAGSFPSTTMFGSGTSGVVDLKTGPILDYVRMQLCSYTLAVDPRPAIARTIRRIALRLCSDGTYKVKEYPMRTWDSDFSEFMEALRSCQKS